MKTFTMIALTTIAISSMSSCECTDNPSCVELDLTFHLEDGMYVVEDAIISDIVSDDCKLESITITDADGDKAEYIELCSPDHDDDGNTCCFHFPDYYEGNSYTGNVFSESGSTDYSSKNEEGSVRMSAGTHMDYHITKVFEDCPVSSHMGKWYLTMKYDDSVMSGDLPAKKVNVCFTWE